MNESAKQNEPLKIVYDKDKKLEEAEEMISDILSQAIYNYMVRNKLLRKDLCSG